MDTCSCDFIQSSSLRDSDPCETLQARRQKGEFDLSWEASPPFCEGISLSEVHERCLPRWGVLRHHLSTLPLLCRLCREHCYVLCWQVGDHPFTESTGQASDQASGCSATPSCPNTAGEFFIHNQINQKVIRFELAFINTIDCVDLVI